MISDFDHALVLVLKYEGGYVNDQNDPGGETNLGISKRMYPDLDIKNLTHDQAKEIYLRDYWQKWQCDQLPHPLNIAHMDCAVNVGNETLKKDGTVDRHLRANRILQRAAKVDDDGIIGPITLKAIAALAPKEIALAAIDEREKYYRDLAESTPRFRQYLIGWLRRTQALKLAIA